MKVDSLEKPPSPIVFQTALEPETKRIMAGQTFGFGMAVIGRAKQCRISNLEQLYGGGLSTGANYSHLPQLA